MRYIYDPNEDIFIEGERFCKHIDPDFDPKQGRRHSWELVEKIQSNTRMMVPGADKAGFVSYDDYFDFWARCLSFDVLISNTDRHAENWAIISSNGKFLMSPLYDNATSMGCEVDDKGLVKWFDDKNQIMASKVKSYAGKGRHHIRSNGRRCKLDEICSYVVQRHPSMRSIFEEVVELDLEPVNELLDMVMSLEAVPTAAKMTGMRKEQIMILLQIGKERIIRTLKET